MRALAMQTAAKFEQFMNKDFRYVFGLSVIFLLAATTFKAGVVGFNTFAPELTYLALLPSIAIALAGARMKASELPKPIRIIFSTCIALTALYAVLSYVSFLPTTTEQANLMAGMKWVLALSTIAAIASFWRPFLGFFSLSYLPWRDQMVEVLSGVMPNDRIDWIVCTEMGLFILLCIAAIQISEKLFSKKILYGTKRGDKENPVKPIEAVFIAALCIHLSNYFFSFYQKVMLAGGPLSWPLENPTYEFIAYALDRGLFPMSALSPQLSYGFYQVMEAIVTPMNIAVFAAQALAIVAFAHKRLAICLTLFFDAMHIGIFLSTGIFFWKWIILNFSIVAALSVWKHNHISPSFKAATIGLVGLSPLFFSVAFLGWYDTHGGRITRVYAHMEDGSRMVVPSNYFISHSFRWIFSYDQALDGGFPNFWGAGVSGRVMSDYKLFKQTEDCTVPLTGKAMPSDHETKGWSAAEDLLKTYHTYVMANVDENGYINYDLYPHHVWSNPFGYQDFKQADKRKIIGYEVANRSVCYRFDEDGTYNPIVRHIGSRYVPIQ